MQTYNKYGQPIFLTEVPLCFCDNELEVLNYPVPTGMKRMYLTKDYKTLMVVSGAQAGTPVITEKYNLVKINDEPAKQPEYVTYSDLSTILNKFKEELINVTSTDGSNTNVHPSSSTGTTI